jgi:outer membrane protein insertion porin family
MTVTKRIIAEAQRTRRAQRTGMRLGFAALVVLGLAPAAFAQEVAPPPDPAAEVQAPPPVVPEALAEPAESEAEDLPIVERVDISGNQYLQKETLLFYVSTKAGERFDERRLKDDFRRLWDTGFINDLLLDVRDGAKGKLVTFVLQERKRVQIVDYRGSKSVTTTNIEDKLKELEAAIRIDSFYDPSKAKKVEAIIKRMLEEKGRPFATVKHDAKSIGPAGMQISFIIDEGSRAKVKEIEFTGNQVFSDRTLRGRMKKVKAGGDGDMLSFFTSPLRWGKTTYNEDKWSDPREGDKAKLQDFYLNRGYVTASVGEPRLTYVDGKSGFFKKKPVKFIRMEIPVSEGDQYRIGEINFKGMTIFKEEGIRPLFKMKTGDVYKESRFTKTYDKLRDAYGAQGYFQWTVGTQRKPDPARKVVDVTVNMEEDKRYYVGKILFTGNESTRDKVIRREVYMNEGDVFNTEALKLSIRRINQLGYFKPMEGPPEIQPSELGEDKLDVSFKVEEQNRNQFTFGGGVSGLEGTFINASFSTSNFLGAGETLQLSAQSGRRTKNYQFAVTEPYLFDRPITAGFDLFSRKITYETFQNVVGYTQESDGMSLVFGLPVGRFSRVFTNYSYEVVNIQGLDSLFGTVDGLDPTTGQPVFDPFFFGEEGRRRESRFSPSFIHNTVDNPYTPRSGIKITSTLQLTGGPLGGDLDYVKPNLEAVFYIPHTRRTALGLRADVGFILPYGTTNDVDPTTGRNGLPLYQRFFLGGETQIRGVNIRSVGPVDELNRALGGNKYMLFNGEYYFDIGGPLRLVLFFDAGQAFLENQGFDFKQLRTSTGAELRFIMPVLNVPFRLIYAVNPNRDPFQPRSAFKFAVGTTF